MYDANTLKILFRFSQIPVTVYTLKWRYVERFTRFFQEPEPFEKDKLEKVKEGLTGKNFSFFPMIHRSLLPCSVAGEKRSTISWDLFPMAEQILLSAEILYGIIRSGNVPNASWKIFLLLSLI